MDNVLLGILVIAVMTVLVVVLDINRRLGEVREMLNDYQKTNDDSKGTD